MRIVRPLPGCCHRTAKPPAPCSWSPQSFWRPVSAIVPDVLDVTSRRSGGPSPLDRLSASTKKLHRQTTRFVGGGVKKVGNDTKLLLTKSKQLLWPWSGGSPASSRRRSAGSEGAGGGLLALPHWWNKQDRSAGSKSMTMSDWLGQPRPGDTE
jgi:hypothetical protein